MTDILKVWQPCQHFRSTSSEIFLGKSAGNPRKNKTKFPFVFTVSSGSVTGQEGYILGVPYTLPDKFM